MRYTLHTVAALSFSSQSVSFCCSEVIIGGDHYSNFYLFGQLLEGLFEERLDQKLCNAAVQGGVSILREVAQEPATAFHE